VTDAELAVLGLVGEMPRYGYEIESTIESRGMREWTEIGFSSIYYVLKKLEKMGLIESQLHPAEGRGPARRVYQITLVGKEALAKATLEAISQPQPTFPPILLGMANLPVLSRGQSLVGLQNYLGSLTERREHVAAQARAQRPLPDHVEMMFDYSLVMIDAEIHWLKKVIGTLEEG